MPDKAAQTFSNLLSSLLKPLAFASKDNFARLSTIKGLEGLVSALCKDAAGVGLPSEISKRFKKLEEIFEGFDDVPDGEKKGRIKMALEMVEDIKEGAQFSPSPQPPDRVRGKLSPNPHPTLPHKGGGKAEMDDHRGDGVLEESALPATTDLPTTTPEEALKNLEKLSTPLRFVKGIGPKLAARLKKKGLSTVEDALYFLPIRYEDRRNIKKIRELEPGKNEVSTGEVMAAGEVRYGRRRVFEAVVSDGSALLSLKWFNYRLPYMKKIYKPGQRLIFYGTVSAFGHKKEIIHPEVEFIGEEEDESIHFGGIIPVYSQIDNMRPMTIRRLVRGVVEEYAQYARGCAPKDAVTRCAFMELKDAFIEAHVPKGGTEEQRLARKSLTFDELFAMEMGLALRRNAVKKEGGLVMAGAGVFEKRLRGLLPFTLTGAQENVIAEIKKDMRSPHPMTRLIQGDVGSGKTIVSYIAVLNAVESDYQAAIMAPTEILAEQHYLTTHNYSEKLGIKTALLTSGLKAAEKRKTLGAAKEGSIDLIIGTHALIQKGVEFKKLGLVVIDEQHRFGVVQRALLKKKGGKGVVSPDMLVMTATPIPRTLSMTVFGDLDVSIIDELPKGRKPVETRILRERDRDEAYRIIRDEVKGGGQAYVVYPLVEESEEMSLKDATNMKGHLERDVFKELSVGLLHGRMKSAEKESVMRDFKDRKLDILVSTTVIEVGVDAPDATVILIEHAERFGLAQLHQLRGRVGRSEKRSLCLLLAQYTQSEDTWKRLKVLEETMDGFRIAEEDLKIRGAGDFIGTRQSGIPAFRTEEALSDLSLLKKAREEALGFLQKDPGLSSKEAAVVKAVLKGRWAGRLELAGVG